MRSAECRLQNAGKDMFLPLLRTADSAQGIWLVALVWVLAST